MNESLERETKNIVVALQGIGRETLIKFDKNTTTLQLVFSSFVLLLKVDILILRHFNIFMTEEGFLVMPRKHHPIMESVMEEQ